MYKRTTIVSFFIFVFIFMVGYPLLKADSFGVELVGQWDEADAEVDVLFIEGNRAYIGDGNRFIILDISNKAAPVKLGEMTVTESVLSIYVSGNYAYVVDSVPGRFTGEIENTGLRIIDISNPGNPQQVGFYSNQSVVNFYYPARTVFVSGNYAYVGTGNGTASSCHGRLDILDISNPTSPQLEGRYAGYFFDDVHVCGDFAYCVYWVFASPWWHFKEFWVFDVSNPASPQRIGGEALNGGSTSQCSIHVSDGYAYVAHYDYLGGNIEVVNVSNPNSPSLELVYKSPGTTEDVFVSGDYVYIAGGSAGLRVAYKSRPYGFYEVAYYDTACSGEAVCVANGYVYMAGGSGGFMIFQVSNSVLNQPQIFLDKTQLYFGAVQGTSIATNPQEVSISNASVGILNWTAASDANWLSVTPQSGSGDSLVSIGVDPNGLAVGSYSGTVTITDPNASNSPQEIAVELKVHKPAAAASPFGYFETPPDSSVVSGSIPVTGWALHEIGVDSVKIYREALPGEGNNLIYIGDAVFVEGARPDVEEAYPGYPLNSRAGWGYMMLTNFLPDGGNGTFKLYAVAYGMNGKQATLGTKAIICGNTNVDKPFGALDTPEQGGPASGSNFRNWGWALTPPPGSIPTNGSTIDVYVDGINLGHPHYNIYRSDIATLFPGYANSDGAGGYFDLDTTAYANGLHTIHWTVKDSFGFAEGIGSRYFLIQNSSQSAERKAQNTRLNLNLADLSRIPPDEAAPIRVTTGFQQNTRPHKVYPADNGIITIETRELQRVEINLGQPGWTGFHLVAGRLRPLPIGSHLDFERGIFCWGPGPGFVGLYELIFINKSKNRLRKINIKILSRTAGL